MTREELIKKWLDNELNNQELKVFQEFEDFEELMQISENVKAFSAPDFNIDSNLNKTLDRIKGNQTSKKSSNWKYYALRIAAVVVIALGVTYFSLNQSTSYDTLFAQKLSIELPDKSNIELNASSSVSFKERSWENSRKVLLIGEAYFQVAKGKSFDVITGEGVITVLGTEFNVKHRNGLFQVICYEGSVKVSHDLDETVLKPGDQFLVLDGKIVTTEKENRTQPGWINDQSQFSSIPYSRVVNELERQYDIRISTENVDLNTLFTGTFTHNDLSLALKSITLPLNLKYHQKDDGTIVLSSD